MGMFDGLKGAKDGDGDDRETSLIDLGGLADAFRKEREGMQKVPKVASRSTGSVEGEDEEPTPQQARDAAMAGPVARGAVDPTTVLTYDDVEAITGDRVDDSVVGFAPSFVSVVFHGAVGKYRVASIHGVEGGSRWKAAKVWKRLLAGYRDAVPVEGLGDEAARTGAFTLVRSGDVILFAEVTPTDPAAGDPVAIADALLRAAIAALPRPGHDAGRP